MMHVISLGAGVQSTTMALMAAHGEIAPMPSCAIFADTGWEPKPVYEHLAWLREQLPFPVHIVSEGNLRQAIINRRTNSNRVAAVPWFMQLADGSDGMGRRQCTAEYKLRPIQKKIVELMGGRPKYGCEVWIGISVDEAIRCKPSRVQYIVNRWPLLSARMNRNDCVKWLERKGYPLPTKSACIGCPYHSDAEWRAIKANPEQWADVLEVDEAIRNQPKFKHQQFMHRSLKPMSEVDLRTDAEAGQPDLFNNECEGMCGV